MDVGVCCVKSKDSNLSQTPRLLQGANTGKAAKVSGTCKIPASPWKNNINWCTWEGQSRQEKFLLLEKTVAVPDQLRRHNWKEEKILNVDDVFLSAKKSIKIE